MNQNAKVNSPILGALLWMTMVFLALFVFLASYLPMVNELWGGGVSGNEWFEENRKFGFLIDRVLGRLIEYPEFFILGAIGFLSLALLHFGLNKIGIKKTLLVLTVGSTIFGLIVFIGAFTLMVGPLIRANP